MDNLCLPFAADGPDPPDQAACTTPSGTRPGGVYLHLDAAFRIMRAEPDFRRWGSLIDALPPEAASEIRPWLREQARKRICYQHYLRRHKQAEHAAPPAFRLAA